MKKLLNILGMVTILSSSSSMVVSCLNKSGNNVDTTTLESTASELSKLAIASQYNSYALNHSDALSYLENQNTSLKTNISKYFLNEGTEEDFVSGQGKIGLSDDSNDVSRSSSIIPDINAAGMGNMSIENIVGVLPTILSASGSILLPMVIKTIAPNFNQQILEEIFSSKILSSDGTILKNTIGTIDQSGNWVIPSDSQYYGKTYTSVLSSIMPTFTGSIINVYNGIKNKTININTINVNDVKNIFTGVFVLMNYFSQFNFISKIDSQHSGQILYNGPSSLAQNSDEYNETCKGEVLNGEFKALNSQNISNLFTNFSNADTNNGLGFQQLLFTIFGGAKNGNEVTPLNEQPLGAIFENIVASILPSLNKDTIRIGIYAIGEIMGTIAESDKITSIIDTIVSIIPAIPEPYQSALQNFANSVKSNNNWYGGSSIGTIWDDIWSGQGSNSFLDVLWNSLGSAIPTLNQFVGIADNISNIYSILENFPIDLNIPNLGKSSTNSEKPKTSFSIKELFSVLGSNGGLINTFLSPKFFTLIENALSQIQNTNNITTFKNDYNNFIKNFGKDINKGNVDPHLSFVAQAENDKCANVLTYISGENVAFMDSSETTTEAAQINENFKDFAQDLLDINNPTSDFNNFIKVLGNAISTADTYVFDNYVQFTFDSTNWKESQVTKTGNNYQFYLSTNDLYYKIELIKDSSDDYYKLSVAQTE